PLRARVLDLTIEDNAFPAAAVRNEDGPTAHAKPHGVEARRLFRRQIGPVDLSCRRPTFQKNALHGDARDRVMVEVGACLLWVKPSHHDDGGTHVSPYDRRQARKDIETAHHDERSSQVDFLWNSLERRNWARDEHLRACQRAGPSPTPMTGCRLRRA